jgi:hypothetical protein
LYPSGIKDFLQFVHYISRSIIIFISLLFYEDPNLITSTLVSPRLITDDANAFIYFSGFPPINRSDIIAF